MNAIILVVDRLQAGYLGCYGNSWIETPAIDRLAGDSFLCDQAFIDTPHTDRLYRSLWQGVHALTPEAALSPQANLPAILAAAGVQTALVTDDASLARHPLAEPFHEVLEVSDEQAAAAVQEIEKTRLSRLFAAAADWLATAREPFCLWMHASALGTVWDAPLEFRQRYVEEDGPDLPELVEPPHFQVPADYDPDELLALRWAYAGQVSLLDTCLESFLDLIDTPQLRETTLFSLLSARGYPLGEHGIVGAPGGELGSALHEELIHVPWLWRFPPGLAEAVRSQALVQTGDLLPTLLDWLQLVTPSAGSPGLMPLVRGQQEALRDRLGLWSGPDERAVRTPAWYLRLSQPAPGSAAELPIRRLYAKPDDRWEVNDVSSRCVDVAEMLLQVLADFEESQAQQRPDQVPLPEVLISGLD